MAGQQQQFVLGMLAYAAQRSVDPQQLCRLSGISLKALQGKKEAGITPAQMNSLWQNACHLAHDPLFGLHLGEALQLAALGVVGQIIQASNTVGDAVIQAAALIPAFTDLFTMEVKPGRKTFTTHFIPAAGAEDAYPFAFRQMMDLCMVFTIHELDGLALEKIAPVSVHLARDVTADAAEYERVLRCLPVKKTGVYSLGFDNRFWEVPVITANYELQQLLLQKAGELNALPPAASMKDKVRNLLTARAYMGIPALEEIAANFATSPRSLQRKLQEEGVTYQQLADDIRHAMALHYVRSGNYPVKEISYMLGYNETSAFTRAFKRWTGKSPAGYRGYILVSDK